MITDIQNIFFSKDGNIYRNVESFQKTLNLVFAKITDKIIATAEYTTTYHQFKSAINDFVVLKRIKLTYRPDNSRKSGQSAYNLSNRLKDVINANQNTIIAENDVSGLNKKNVIEEFEDDTKEFDSLAGDWEVKGLTSQGNVKTIKKSTKISSITLNFRNPGNDDAVFEELKEMAKQNE
jgi:uncharacterized protein YutD